MSWFAAVMNNERPVHILLVEDEPDLRNTLRYNLRRHGYVVTDAGNGQEALDKLRAHKPDDEKGVVDVVISDVMMPVLDGIGLARALRANEETRELPLLFLTAKGDAADRLEGFRVGADDYLTKPFDLEELLARVQVQARRSLVARKVRRLMPEKPAATGPSPDLYAKVAVWEQRFPALAAIRADQIVGASTKTLTLLREVLVRAPGKDPVLIVGETGTGKTGVAEALHRLGPRSEKSFRVVNCAELASADQAITAGKLFGFGKGSGLQNVSKDGQPGLLEDVDGGTLFFDEIHRLPMDAQAMLLLPIEGRAFHPAVGKGNPKIVDVKFIFATNIDLKAEAQAGRFPFDLYQRLAQSQIKVPALAERREDILVLANHFLDECKAEFDLQNATFARSLARHLVDRDYPGNIRELRHLVRELARRAAFELDTVLAVEHLPEAWEGGVDQMPTTTTTTAPTTTTATTATATATATTEKPGSQPPRNPDKLPPGTDDDAGGFWNEVEMAELQALRKHRFRIAEAERELGLSSKSRTLTNHLRGLCFKALAHTMKSDEFDVDGAARLVVGRDDEALVDRTVERVQSYLEMVEKHAAAHTTELLFNNLPRDYRKHVERAIEAARSRLTPAFRG